jgi:hypothetical protein
MAMSFILPLLALALPARAANNGSELVKSLPAQIPEIVTGGKWSNGDIGGTYRAVVVLSDREEKKPDLLAKSRAGAGKKNNGGKNIAKAAGANDKPERKAEVYIQWIAYENGKARPHIVKTVSVREFNEKQLRHAFLAMDTINENEMTLLVTSYDEKTDKDIAVTVRATTPGKYKPAK